MMSTTISPTGSRQRGAALVFSLLILLVLTILGMSAMRTSSLEQIMAGNTQELNRAFQAADSGMAKAFDTILTNAQTGVTSDPAAFDDVAFNLISYPAFGAQAEKPDFVQIGLGARGRTASNSKQCFSFYNQKVTGTSRLSVTSRLNHGLRAPAPDDDNRETSCS